MDHFNYDTVSAAEKHDVLLLDRPGPLRPDAVNFFGGDGVLAVPRAVGQTLGNASPLIAPILKAPTTAYAYNPKEAAESLEEPFATGSQLSLISAMQARNSARFVVLGSLEMLQDQWFDASVKSSSSKNVKTVNRLFARQLTEWTFKEVGVLNVLSVQHQEVFSSKRCTRMPTRRTFSVDSVPDTQRQKHLGTRHTCTHVSTVSPLSRQKCTIKHHIQYAYKKVSIIKVHFRPALEMSISILLFLLVIHTVQFPPIFS